MYLTITSKISWRTRMLLCIVAVTLVVCLIAGMSLNLEPSKVQRTAEAVNRADRHVNCIRLFAGDEHEQLKAHRYQTSNPKRAISNYDYIQGARDCSSFIAYRNYIISPSSNEEQEFPLAFDVLVYKDVELFERLLRAIYRPHNVYCVHVDKKATSSLHEAVGAIVNCFKNVFVLRNNIEITWGKYSVLEAEILCMKALLAHKNWKYFINLTGQEFPLRTNLELVRILKVLNGSNIIGATIKWAMPKRLAGRPPPPIAVTPLKGPLHITARREFVEFAINDEKSRKLLNWTKLVDIPDEIFFSTLNHNPQLGIPGSYLGVPEMSGKKYPFLNRFKIWKQSNLPCHGIYSHSICIFGINDLPALASSRHFFANKFHLHYQPVALDCLEELIYNRTQRELLGNRSLDLSFYRKLDVVKNHI